MPAYPPLRGLRHLELVPIVHWHSSICKTQLISLTANRSYCNDPGMVQIMMRHLPDGLDDRAATGAYTVGISGDDPSKPFEIQCILNLNSAPPPQPGEPVIQQFYRTLHGGAGSSWPYTIA